MKNLFQLLLLIHVVSFIAANADAQKKWDGQGNDSLWSNPKNWFPDGLPSLADDVLLDNSIISGNYHVTMNADSGMISIRSLSILPGTQDIKLELPVGNKLSPALSLGSPNQSLVIGAKGSFLNKSGALAGNSMELAGNLIILNNGTYIHATVRGNANIVSKLIAGPTTNRGVFLFDVPGTAGYTISITGRQFGILRLQSLLAGKKSYSGSGSSNLTLWGGLEIGDSTTLTSTLTGNIMISGNLAVKGKLSLVPVTAGITGRELQFSGDSNSIQIDGLLETGANFKMMVAMAGTTVLKSNVRLDKETSTCKVLSHAKLDLDSFSLTGPGLLATDSASVLKSSNPIFKSTDTSKGAIRTAHTELHNHTGYVFFGSKEQHTGDAFPDSIGALTLSKTSCRLWLDKSLVVIDSLQLLQGIVHTDSLHILKVSGVSTGGNKLSFVHGPLCREIKTQGLHQFAVGMHETFNPLSLQGQMGTFQTEYIHQPPPNITMLTTPLEKLTDSGYWQVNMMGNDSTYNGTILIPDSTGIGAAALKTNRVAYWTTEGWVMLQPNGMSSSSPFINGQLTGSGKFQITKGFIQPAALPLDRIHLTVMEKKDGLHLEWFGNWDDEPWKMQIEQSDNGRDFIAINTDESRWVMRQNHCQYWVPDAPLHLVYFRICASNADGKKVYSNIAYVRGLQIFFFCYPNPATDFIQAQLPEGNWKNLRIWDSNGKCIYSYKGIQSNRLSVDISKLPTGAYFMTAGDGQHQLNTTFLKK